MTERTCSLSDCGKPHQARGYCQTHLARYYRNGKPELQPERKRGMCTVPGCERPHKGHGYCSGHLQRDRRGADLAAPVPIRDPDRGCSVSGCRRKHHGNGLCDQHYYAANKDLYKQRGQAWTQNNREAVCARSARRRTRRRLAMDAFDRMLSTAYRQAIGRDDCGYCGAPGEHTDHVFPLAKGGTDHWWNLVRACSPCNLSKANRCGTWFRLIRTGR